MVAGDLDRRGARRARRWHRSSTRTAGGGSRPGLRRSGHSASESRRRDEQRRPQRTPEPGQRRQLLLGLGAGLGVALPQYCCITCSNSAASRSAKCWYMRRCRALMPCASNPAAADAIAWPSSSNSRVAAVVADRLEQAERLELVQLPVVEAGGLARARGACRPSLPPVEAASSGASGGASSGRAGRAGRLASARGAGRLASARFSCRGGVRASLFSRRGVIVHARPVAVLGARSELVVVGRCRQRVAERKLRREILGGAPRLAGRTAASSGLLARDRVHGRRLLLAHAVESLLDDLQREEVLLLLVQDPAQPGDVGVVELAVPRRRALRVDEALALEEPDLRDRDVGNSSRRMSRTSPIDRCDGSSAASRLGFTLTRAPRGRRP